MYAGEQYDKPVADLHRGGRQPTGGPAWRFHLAASAARSGQMLFRRDHDERTVNLADYLADELACADRTERARLAREHPAIAGALELWRDRPRLDAVFVEAALLARRTSQEAAHATNVAAGTIRRYRWYFFSFGRRIDDAAYVLQHAVASEFHPRSVRMEARRAASLKFISYFCGAAGLKALGLGTRLSSDLWLSGLPVFERAVVQQYVGDLVERLATGAQTDTRLDVKVLAELKAVLEQTRLNRVPANRMEESYWK